MTRHGFRIICPDGKYRHYPYGNYGDAIFDAKYCSKNGCTLSDKQKKYHANTIAIHGLCPEGEHIVEPYTFDLPPLIGQA